MFIESYTNMSPRFILILNRTRETIKNVFSNQYVYDNVANFEVQAFMENTKI